MSPKPNNRPVFSESILPDGPSRARAFGAGFGLECLTLAAILIIPIFMPQRLVVVAKDWATPIAMPIVRPWKPQPKPVVKKVVVKQPPKPKPVEVAMEVPKPKLYDPVISSPIKKQTIERKDNAPTIDTAKKIPDQVLGSSAIPTLKKPRELVQTGGFGDPQSVPDNHNKTRAPNMNAMGSFDLPAGPGYGNGTGGAKGSRGIVASTGFGDQVAKGAPSSGHGAIEQGGFGAVTAGGPGVKQTSAPTDRYKPMEILFVPKPQYPQEAREKKIEGDVVLQVVFSASGEVRVARVVQGLGYGLDEAAESAARQIRFHPATNDGQPVDTTANVRMKCELAY
ncbi:MAG TPA: energy transducer TonB [Candidatus Acidoferrales bacterium]|nr:energy transducer TonB [Candidatus Acidoferrales bacterium]